MSVEFANRVEYFILATIAFLVMCIAITMLSGLLYALLKMIFGKATATATEPEPGQVSKKAKKSAPPVDSVGSFERIEPTFGNAAAQAFTDSPLLAKSKAKAVIDSTDADTDADTDAAVLERDSAFADRMADQFAAEPVTA